MKDERSKNKTIGEMYEPFVNKVPGEIGEALREAYDAVKHMERPSPRKDRDAFDKWREIPEVKHWLRMKRHVEFLIEMKHGKYEELVHYRRKKPKA